ncbi:MAG: sigma-54-dependent Fis family transcriptional regulator [Deltaproteobacteria bacterium]|nr:sigma-54-dependent Fis family transcriptional regulator [Deltaproteobacteria bacterium]
MLRILIAEDEAHNRDAMAEMLRRLGHEVVTAADGQAALECAAEGEFNLVFSDVRMPRMDGIQFFESFRRIRSASGGRETPFVFMTAYGRLEEAVSAMRQGALHFLTKPLRKSDIVPVLLEVERAAQRLRARRTSAAAGSEARGSRPIFASRAFADLVATAEKVAASLASVLIVGESGTGKEVIARHLHAASARGSKPFMAFNAGAVPETLVESELFGFEKGAFTGADAARAGLIRSAEGGSFFIDEIGSMPLAAQVKLLRVIQERQVQPLGATKPALCDVRWIAASHRSLQALVQEGLFREDLLYRLSVVVLEVPTLRNRAEDVEPLTRAFLAEFARRDSRAELALDSETLDLLRSYSWPGNVRELRNVVERATALAAGACFTPELLPPHIAQAERSREIRIAVGTSLQSAEDRLIEETLRLCDGDKNKAAGILGVAPRTIYRWLERR